MHSTSLWQHRLGLLKLKVMPTRFGIFFLGLSIVMYLFGSSYQNPLILLLALLMLSLFISCWFLCAYNLYGLHIRLIGYQSPHAGAPCQLEFSIRHRRTGHQIQLKLDPQYHNRFLQLGKHWQPLLLKQQTIRRGALKPSPLYVSSRYPLGLCKVQVLMEIEQLLWVWPSPKFVPSSTPKLAQQTKDELDELDFLAPWKPGESLSRIAWKSFSQGKGLQSKTFSSVLEPAELELCTEHHQLERHLSELTTELLQCHQQGIPFGLRTPHQQTPLIPPNLGAGHLKQCLDLLAKIPTKATES